MASIDEIRLQSARFRQALELCSGQLHAISLKEFPFGSCGDVSDMLGMFLYDVLAIKCYYVSGWNENRTQSHAWLELDGIVIDITADQFNGNDSVIVSKESTFHCRFMVESRRTPSIDESTISGDLWHDYDLVVETI